MEIELFPTIPTLSRSLTILSCVFFTSSYVGSLYIFRATRVGQGNVDEHGRLLTRDHPKVIKARIAGVMASSVVSVVGVYFLVRSSLYGQSKVHIWSLNCLFPADVRNHSVGVQLVDIQQVIRTTARLLGFQWPHNILKGTMYPLALTATLFLGPLYTASLDKALPFQVGFDFRRDVTQKLTSWHGIRNYLVVSALNFYPFLW